MRKIVFVFFLSFIFKANAQKTLIYSNPEQFYQHALELYNKELYGSAVEYFEKYISLSINNNRKHDALIYSELSKLKNGNENAENVLLEIIENKPEFALNNLIYLELGNFYFENNKYKRASGYFEKTDLNGINEEKEEELNFRMAYSYFKAGKYDKSKTKFETLRNRQGKYFVISNYYYGYICYQAKNYDCAIKSFEKIKDENYESIPLFIAQIYYAKGEYQKAIDYSNKINNEKYTNDLNLIKGKSSFQLKKYDEAYKFFSKCNLSSLKPSNEERYEIGFSAFNQKKYEDAIAQFLKLSSLDIALGQIANYYLAQSFFNLDKKQNAYNAFAEAKRLNHDKSIKEISHFNYGKLAVELGYSNIALKSIQDFISEYPNSEYNDEAKGLLAELFLQTKNYKQACDILSGIKNHNEQSKKAFQIVHFHRAEELFIDKNFTESESYFKKSLKYNIDKKLEGEAWYWLGEISYKNSKFTDAISNYNRFLNIAEANSSSIFNNTYYNLGYCYYSEKNYVQALNYYKKYKDVSSYVTPNAERYIDNILRLADCYFLVSQYDKAAETYGFVSSKKIKESDYATFQQGIIYGLLDKRELKIATLRNIPQYYPKSQYTDDALYEIGAEYLEDDNYSLAESFFVKLTTDYPTSVHIPDALLKLGLINYNQKKQQQAINYYMDVVKKFPKTTQSEVALDALEIIYVQNGKGDEFIEIVNKIPGASVRLSYQDSILYQSALTNYNDGNCIKAVSGFKTYLTKFSINAFFYIQANFMIAECEYKDKKYDEALSAYKIVADASKSEFSEKSVLRVARIYYFKKEFSLALPYYELLNKYATTKENTLESLVGLMRCHFINDNLQMAKKYAIEILPIQNVQKDVLVETNMNLGRIAMKDKSWRTAQFHFNYVLKENKAALGAEALYNKAEIEYNVNKKDSCKNIVFKLNDDFPSYEYWVVKGFILLSDVYRDEKDYFQAKATLQSVIDNYDGKELLAISKAKLEEIIALEKVSSETIKEDDE